MLSQQQELVLSQQREQVHFISYAVCCIVYSVNNNSSKYFAIEEVSMGVVCPLYSVLRHSAGVMSYHVCTYVVCL